MGQATKRLTLRGKYIPQAQTLEKWGRYMMYRAVRGEEVTPTQLRAAEVIAKLLTVRASDGGDGVDIAGPTLVERYGERHRRAQQAGSGSVPRPGAPAVPTEPPGASAEPAPSEAGASDNVSGLASDVLREQSDGHRGPFDAAPVPPADLTPDGARAYPSTSPSPPENFPENSEKSAPTGESDGLAKG